MHWPAATVAALDAAADSARSGRPTALGIQAHAGYGKSTLLRDTAGRLPGFHVLRAYGEQSAQDERFQLLHAWEPEARPRNAMQGTRLLSTIVDRQQLTGPVALVVDDLQWMDPDSVQILAALVERAAGDRLLVLAAYRPLGRRHAAWRQLGVKTVDLDGLDLQASTALVTSVDPSAPSGLAEALRVHTSGSPLHMRALLQEHSTSQLFALAGRGELPAPADLAAAVDARIAELAPDAGRLLHALAVLGDTWSDVATAASVAGVNDVDTAVELLVEQDLLLVDRSTPQTRIRIAHAVLRAAAYETIPTTARRGLHRAAAARLTDSGDRLRHRLSAAVGPDDGLSSDLERHAGDRHARGLFRQAARYLRLAADASTTPVDRERRALDADVDMLLANDLDSVAVVDIDEGSSTQRRLVYAMRLSVTKQWVRAARVMDDVDTAQLDPRNRYRALVMRAWTILASGRPPAAALPFLQAAAAEPVQDGAYRGLFLLTNGQVQHATISRDGPLWGFDEISNVDRAALTSSVDGLHLLSWRGSVYAITGSTDRAIGDLSLVTERMDDGMLELSDGVMHAFLGFAQWCRGDWQRASITLGLSQAFVRGVQHPTVLAVAPLIALATGDDPRPSLALSRDARLSGPVPAALYCGDVCEVAVLAFTGTPTERSQWHARRTADFGAPEPGRQRRPPALWLLAMGIGAYWAGNASATQEWADALADRPPGEWRATGVSWLRALAAHLRGEPTPDMDLARAGMQGLESFAAILSVDAAQRTRDPALVGRTLSRLESIGAGRYAPTLLAHTQPIDDPLTMLSDRERDVTSLVMEGLSYAQIAQELHVTRSTVSFHLSNIYPKTNTSSRHELTQLLRPQRRQRAELL